MTYSWIARLSLGLACAAGCANQMGASKNEDRDADNEVQVSMAQLPPAVRDTLARESAGGRIDEIVKVSEDGRTFYESDVMLNGEKWELAISESGRLMHKKSEKSEKQTHEEHEKHENNENNDRD